jgi:hypothetical protein
VPVIYSGMGGHWSSAAVRPRYMGMGGEYWYAALSSSGRRNSDKPRPAPTSAARGCTSRSRAPRAWARKHYWAGTRPRYPLWPCAVRCRGATRDEPARPVPSCGQARRIASRESVARAGCRHAVGPARAGAAGGGWSPGLLQQIARGSHRREGGDIRRVACDRGPGRPERPHWSRARREPSHSGAAGEPRRRSVPPAS